MSFWALLCFNDFAKGRCPIYYNKVESLTFLQTQNYKRQLLRIKNSISLLRNKNKLKNQHNWALAKRESCYLCYSKS